MSYRPKQGAPTMRERSPRRDHRAGDPVNPIAKFDTTMGEFEAEIFLDRVPVTASNFIDLCKTGFYEGLHFHRVIEGFMNQFGCPYSKDPHSFRSGTGGPDDGTFKNLKAGGVERRFGGGNIKDENISRDSNLPFTMSMANCGSPNSGGSQFFLNVSHNKALDWFSPGTSKHPVFGKVHKGMDVVLRISKVPTKDQTDCPVAPIRMKKIIITGLPDDEPKEKPKPKPDPITGKVPFERPKFKVFSVDARKTDKKEDVNAPAK